jgi:uncharacterized protein (TIGR00730 family)
MLGGELGSLGIDLHAADGVNRNSHASILSQMSQQRRPPGKPTEDRKLLRPAPYADTSFLETDAWRALRIMGEFVEGFDALADLGPAVSVFGSARLPDQDPSYAQAEELGRRLAEHGITVITGGGPGIMEAANKGAKEAGGESVGLAIELPHEQSTNPYCTRVLNFRYFFVRKTMFVKYAQGFIIFPGGFGTFDELFESLTLVQTGKIEHFPVILVGTRYWQPLVDWLRDPVTTHGMIGPNDVDLFRCTDDTDQAVAWIEESFAAARADERTAKEHPQPERVDAAHEIQAQRTTKPE